MSRGSDSFVWGIRWETVDSEDDTLVTGAQLPGMYATLRDAQREQRRLEEEQPTQPDPLGGLEPRPVHYLIYARDEAELGRG
jgi:hypothetical protein